MPHPKKMSNEEKFDSLIMSDLRSRTALNSIADTFLSASADPVGSVNFKSNGFYTKKYKVHLSFIFPLFSLSKFH